MRNTIWNQRIPTLLGIVLIIVGIGALSYIIQSGLQTTGQASTANQPDKIRITNVSETAFTVSYKTATSVPGTVAYGETPQLGSVAIDDKDQQSGNVTASTIHYITVKNLKPNTKYYFSITSGSGTFLNHGKPFDVTTASSLQEQPSQQPPLTGKVILDTGTPLNIGIAYVTAQGGQALSAPVKNDGSYIIPLNTMRLDTLSTYLSFSDTMPLQILIVSDQGESTVLLTPKQSNPVPLITLSQNYDFTQGSTPLSTEQSASATQSAAVKFPTVTANEVGGNTAEPQITTPQNGDGFVDQQPMFRGTGPANTEVEISIHSNENIQTQVKTDAQGNWNYRPTQALSPGDHTITIKTRDEFGILKIITQKFVVHAEGSQVTQSATRSATPRPTVTPTPTIITRAPTSAVTPTSTPIPVQITATPTPIDQVNITITPHPPIENPGSGSLMLTGLLAIAATSTGFVLLFLSRGGVRS